MEEDFISMTREQLRLLFSYNQWANRRVIEACAALTEEQFVKELGSSFSSVRDTLAHIYGGEWLWYERLFGLSPRDLPPASGFPDLASVRQKLEEKDVQFIEYISRLSPVDLDRVFRYRNIWNEEMTPQLWQMLQHLANHSTYHRGQVTTLLRQLGAKPVSTDLIAFYRERAAGAHA
jgi:uncharacterized damage-inducible protein DinB